MRIAHLSGPDHFVVVTRAGAKSVAYLDHQGRRQIMATPAFARRWTGYVLRVERPAAGAVGFTGEPDAGKPRVRFDTLFIDKGDVVTGADVKAIRFEYPFRNAGHAPLTIRKVHAGCSCLKATHPDKPIQPGGTGAVVLEYTINPNKRSFVHDAVVETDDPTFPALALRAAGNTNVLVTISPASLSLGDLPLGAEKRVFVFVRYNGEEDFELHRATAKHSSATVHSEASKDLADGVSLGAAMPTLSACHRVVELRYPQGRRRRDPVRRLQPRRQEHRQRRLRHHPNL